MEFRTKVPKSELKQLHTLLPCMEEMFDTMVSFTACFIHYKVGILRNRTPIPSLLFFAEHCLPSLLVVLQRLCLIDQSILTDAN